MDDGLRRGLELASSIVAGGLFLLLGVWRLAEGLSDDVWWKIALGVLLLIASLLSLHRARQLHRGD